MFAVSLSQEMALVLAAVIPAVVAAIATLVRTGQTSKKIDTSNIQNEEILEIIRDNREILALRIENIEDKIKIVIDKINEGAEGYFEQNKKLESYHEILLKHMEDEEIKFQSFIDALAKAKDTNLKDHTNILHILHSPQIFGFLEVDRYGQVIWTDPNLKALTGYSLEEVEGDGWQKVIFQEDLNRVLNEWDIAQLTKVTLHQEFRIQRKNGMVLPVTATTYPFIKNGIVNGWFSCIKVNLNGDDGIHIN